MKTRKQTIRVRRNISIDQDLDEALRQEEAENGRPASRAIENAVLAHDDAIRTRWATIKADRLKTRRKR